MNDLIYRQQAVDELERGKDKTAKGEIGTFYNTIIQKDINKILMLPSAQKTCRWTNKGVFYGDGVDAWQECECSRCGRWDTRPYAYYFDEPRFCSFCGAKMQKGEANASTNS